MKLKSETTFLIIVLLALFTVVLLRTAWVCDDAFITFRTIRNFLQGYGLTYNPAERVQSYTNPLWMFLLSVPGFFTKEPYYTSISLSLLLSLAAVLILVFGIARSQTSALAALVILILSKTFTDYSTSGLENPLTYLILAGFCYVFLKYEPDERKILLLSLLASLGTLNRMDTILLFIPTIAFALWQTRKIRAFRSVIAGFSPFILWECFSLFYYGFLFPNTAYAKLNTGIPSAELIKQGLYYFLNSLNLDPLTLLIISITIFISFFRENRKFLPLSIGVILYLLYIIRIGGDFMSGRFFSAPLFMAVILISNWELSNLVWGLITLMVILLGVSSPSSPVLSKADYGLNRQYLIDNKGICDERAWYYQELGLLNANRYFAPHLYGWRKEDGRELPVRSVALGRSNVGRMAFLAEAGTHLVDVFALVDPLLARLPAQPDPNWRIGHFIRTIPEGYLETLETGQNKIKNKDLALYYDKVALITRGKVWSLNRLKEIIKFNLGDYNHLVESGSFQLETTLQEINTPKPEGTVWNSAGNIIISPKNGLKIKLGEISNTSKIEIGLDNNDHYQISYFSGSQLLAKQKVAPKRVPAGGLAIHILDVPATAIEKGFDTIKILPKTGDGIYAVGYLKIIK